MADNPRIEDLRRRVQKDPASIAFAQLAEEYRRAGSFQEAVETCLSGLARHPTYLSARVTLGRSLIELNELEEALNELEQVLKAAPENLAAIRGVAEIHQRRGNLPEALAQYRAALLLARNDPDLEQTVIDICQRLEKSKRRDVPGGMSLEQAQEEFLATPDGDVVGAPPRELEMSALEPVQTSGDPAVDPAQSNGDSVAIQTDPASPVSAMDLAQWHDDAVALAPPDLPPTPVVDLDRSSDDPVVLALPSLPAPPAVDLAQWNDPPLEDPEPPAPDPNAAIITELEHWLDAILQDRAQRHESSRSSL